MVSSPSLADPFRVEANDWISSGLAAISVISSIVLAIWGTRKNKEAQANQEALAAEQRMSREHQGELERSQSRLYDRLGDVLAELSDRGPLDAGTPPSRVAPVEWVAEQVRKNSWILRNLSTTPALDVTIDKEALGGVRVDFDPALPAVVKPGGSLRINAFGAFGAPIADEVTVYWGDGQEAVVPLPRWQ
jgi:hypothetical protein